MYRVNTDKGLTLIETLIASAIFLMIAVALSQMYMTFIRFTASIRNKTVLTEVISEQFEFVRNLNYSDVGIVGGIPSGVVPQTQTVTRNGTIFSLTTTIRNIDNAADGTLGGTPNDLSPADNKFVEIEGVCTTCQIPVRISYSSLVAPKNLETENGNGVIIIKTIDANGTPVPDALVQIVNSALSPAVSITDVTDNTGTLTIVDAPPSTQQYKITVTKNGFSTEQTYAPEAVANPNPVKPNLTVSANKISQGTFAIDRVSTLKIKTQSPQCIPIGNVSGTLVGTKIIGTPNVVKNTIPFTTTASGVTTLSTIEWDTYTFSLGGSTYSVAGSSLLLPLDIVPNTSQDFILTLKPTTSNNTVLVVIDSTETFIAGATVTLVGSSGTYTKTTDMSTVTQTDWSLGPEQALIGDWKKFYTTDGAIETTAQPGRLSLMNTDGVYGVESQLTSSTIDVGIAATFDEISWTPMTQTASIGPTPVRFQIATNNDQSTWNFIGPDGTDQTYYTVPMTAIAAIHTGDQYLRYRVFLSTVDTSQTPLLNDVTISYTTQCLPKGHVDFSGLASGNYTMTVSKPGFATITKPITINGNVYDITTLIP